jgi:hypothetical protein
MDPPSARNDPKQKPLNDFSPPTKAYYNGRMLTRHLAVLAVLVSIAAGCEDEKAKADLQKKADERIAKIESQAAEKVATAEKKIAELEGQLAEAGAQAKAEADEEVTKAKGDVDKLASEAADALKKARAAYKDSERHELATLLKELDDVKAKAQSAQPKVKTQVDQALKDITPKKDAVKKDIEAFDTASLETLRAAKAKTDQALAQLKQAIHAAKAKLQ